MKILLLDIETSPNTAFVWGLFDQNISHDHLVETSRILCWAAKWYGSKEIKYSECSLPTDDVMFKTQYLRMMFDLRALLDEADVVVHYYGSKFDIPTVNKEFVKLKILPPSPYKQIDLKLVVAKVFRFESNKLDFVAETLGYGKKIKTEFQLWVDCMNGDKKQWEYMRKYNKHDVVLLDKVYKELLPWIEKHPNWGIYTRSLCCPKCGGKHCTKQGTRVATTRVYQQYRCKNCGGWFRSNIAIPSKGEIGVNIIP